MKKDKRSLLKFALIPLVLLLLMFSSNGGQYFGSNYNQNTYNEIIINQIAPLDVSCTNMFLNKTISTDLDGQLYLETGETELYDITIPSGVNIYAVIEWNFYFCWGKAKMACNGDESLQVYNAIDTPLNARFSAPYNNYGDGVTIMLSPGGWILNLTSDVGACPLCYDITIHIYGCGNTGISPVIEGQKIPPPP
jgi:hypothetical protein